MGTINSTSLATSTPRTLTTGFPIFPAGTSRNNPAFPRTIGIGQTPTRTFSLFQTTIPLVFWRFRGSATGTVISGAFFGFNLGYTVQGETRNNGTATLNFSNDSARGGMAFGIGCSFTVSLALEQTRLSFSWRSGFRTTWQSIFNTSVTVSLDLIDITLRILRASGLNVPVEHITEVRGTIGSGAIWGLLDSTSGRLSSSHQLVLRPRISVSGNLLSLVPGFGPFLKGLKKAGGKLHVGPVLNFIFPITISIVRLTTEDGVYEAVDRQGVFDFSGGPVGSFPNPVREVQITHSHTVGLTFGLEFKASFSAWSIFSVSATIPFNLSDTLGFPTAFGTYFTALSNTRQSAAELPEVVWG